MCEAPQERLEHKKLETSGWENLHRQFQHWCLGGCKMMKVLVRLSWPNISKLKPAMLSLLSTLQLAPMG